MIDENYSSAIGEVREALGSYLLGDGEFKGLFHDDLVNLIKARTAMCVKFIRDYNDVPSERRFPNVLNAMYIHKSHLFLLQALDQVENPKEQA